MRVSTSVSIPSSLQTTQSPHDVDTEQRILIASFVGVAILLVMILLFAIYCYNKRNPVQVRHNYNANRNNDLSDTVYSSSDVPTTYVYENKGLHYGDQDSSEFAHDISIKLKIQWDDMYGNVESEKFKTLRDQIVESMEDLYKHYCEFRGAILLKLRKGSVVADIRLKFSKLAVEPLKIIKSAVTQGKCSSIEVEKDYFILDKRCSRQSRSDKTESGYGSQFFEHISFVEKSQEQKLTENSKKFPTSKSTSDLKSTSETSADSVTVLFKGDAAGKVGKKVMKSRSLSRSAKLKNKNVTQKDGENKRGLHHVARFDFSPQDYQELALNQGEFVDIVCVDPSGWVKVINSCGEQGWVPRNFIAEIDPEAYVNTKKAVESIIFYDRMIESADVPCDVVENANIVTNNSYELIANVYVAIYPFDPTDVKELKLEVGDLIDVSKKSETGWWKGCCVRTSSVGWFPSTYVKPNSTQIDSNSLFADLSHVGESVSDSELHSSKKRADANGYYSDNEENKVQENFMLPEKGSDKSMSCECEHIDDVTDGTKKHGTSTPESVQPSASPPEAYPRDTIPCAPNERVDTFQRSAVNPASEPPAKPVPPKPRKLHIKQAYQRLAATGTTNDLFTRSLESLRVTPVSYNRRHSEEMYTPHDNCHKKEMFLSRLIGKERPLSFQGAPRFLQLANRYASDMKPSWSLPSLNGDQIKLSPDDDRPYLEPIPRKNKISCTEILDLNKLDAERNNFGTGEYIKLNPVGVEQCKSMGKAVSFVDGTNESVDISQRVKETEAGSTGAPQKPPRDSLKYGISVKITTSDDARTPKERSQSFGDGCETNSRCNDTKVTTDDGFALVKPCTRGRSSSHRNFTSFECINEEGESTIKKDTQEEPICVDDETSGHEISENKDVSMCTSNPHERIILQKQSNIDCSFKNDLMYYKNGISTREKLQAEDKHRFFSRKINSFGEEESEEDSSVSRASSTLSLSSFNSSNASSSRSTTSSKHEQMNLRRATMNVYSENNLDLSFQIGAMLYELRPRNKAGMCFGLLEDSTQGWYPAESAEPFQERV